MARKSTADSEYADHARPADYVARVEIWTENPLRLQAITRVLTTEMEKFPAVTAVRVTVTPKVKR